MFYGLTIFCKILSVPYNIVMKLNNVMMESPKLMSNFPKVLNLNRLFFKLDRWAFVSSDWFSPFLDMDHIMDQTNS